MGLTVWNSAVDVWDRAQFANNLRKIDEHDHANGRGKQIPTGGIEDGAVTLDKLSPEASAISDGSIDTRHLKDGAVTNPKLAIKSVATDNILDDSVNADKIRENNVYARHLKDTTAQALGVHTNGRRHIYFTPGVPNQTFPATSWATAPRTSGQTDMAKVVIPPGGGLLHIYAEGVGNWNAPSGDYAQIGAYVSLSTNAIVDENYDVILVREPIGSILSTTGGPFTWRSYPGAYEQDTDSSTAATARSKSGGVVTRYISAGSSGRIVSVKLEVYVGGSASATLGRQDMVVWSERSPSYTTTNWPDL